MIAGDAARRTRAVLVLGSTALSLTLLGLIHACTTRRPATVRDFALPFQRLNGGLDTIVAGPMNAPTGPAVLVATVGRGDLSTFGHMLPRLDGGTPLQALALPHPYARWPTSGTAAYAATLSPNAPGPTISLPADPSDEVTLAAVLVDGSRVQDLTWVERPAAWTVTSSSVTTTGPATLIGFWWGDAGIRHDKRVVPLGGFTLLDGVLESGSLVQAAVAARRVNKAGTYSVTWAAWPKQGAQLWLIAIE